MTALVRFFIIGAQRCGTTLLHDALAQHPDVAMNQPVRPEPKPFLAPDSSDLDVEQYDERYFADRTSPVRGEKATTYIEQPAAGARILRRFPEARFLVMVRDPVARAISNYNFTVAHGLEPLPLREAMTEEAEARPWRHLGVSTSPFHYLRRGHYATFLDDWVRVVERDRLLVTRLEDLSERLSDVQAFLGLTPHPAVTVSARVNTSTAAASRADVDAVRPTLARHFASANQDLAARWGVPLHGWA